MRRVIISFFMLAWVLPAFPCTSVIISSRHNARPVMLKHRDTDELNNRIERFEGEKFAFIGLVNSPSGGGEVWAGMNSAGFCIMNTATYDLKDDDVPADLMDREGVVMYRALGICSCTADFEYMLDTLSRPMGVEANFGVIDAHGGAAYYEVNNHSWVKFDVCDPSVAPSGYMVVTNFTRTGRPEDRKGVDRFEKASDIMEKLVGEGERAIGHEELLSRVSRSGRPIIRDITSASIVFEGVVEGSDAEKSVMWTVLGWPGASVAVPLLVGKEDYIPSYLKAESGMNAEFCDNALSLKWKEIGSAVQDTENFINSRFSRMYGRWCEGKIGDRRFISKYKRLQEKIYKHYHRNFDNYLG